MKNLHKALILSSAIFAANSQAEITLNGFASIVGGVTTSSDDTLYGYDQDIDFSQGSLFAIQASADLGDSLTATVQLLARGENDWDPDFEWAYIAYDASDNLRVLAGRQRVPFYMYSDFLDVSYAYPWITPPEGVYSVAFDTFDGLGAIYSTSMGSFDANFGECGKDAKNNLPITKGWNFIMRVYEPKLDQLDAYKLPTPVKVKAIL